MMVHYIRRIVLGCSLIVASTLSMGAWPGMDMPRLRVEGRFLVDEHGNHVNLHGFGQTYSPWFNEMGSKWSNYNVNACLNYNKGVIDGICAAGWRANFVRMHMDPYWSNTPGVSVEGEHDISGFSFDRFKKYLDQVFVPMAKYIISKGMYVVMRPPGVCPQQIAVGDAYHRYLKQVWGYVSTHPELCNNPAVMFELANEPVNILGDNGNYSATGDDCYRNLTRFFQEIVDVMRSEGCNNILWVPGTGYQSCYAGYSVYPIKGSNIGYAVHCYPGWYGSDCLEPSHELGGEYGGGYEKFRDGWNAQVGPVAAFAPVMVTEMDWAPTAVGSSWGKSITGRMYGSGFGANFKLIADETGNVSWMIFTGPEILARFDGKPGTEDNYTILNHPEACVWPAYHWFKEYAGDDMPAPESMRLVTSARPVRDDEYVIQTGGSMTLGMVGQYNGYESDLNARFDVTLTGDPCFRFDTNRLYADGSGTVDVSLDCSAGSLDYHRRFTVTSSMFPLVNGVFNPSIWEAGTFDDATGIITTGQYGFAGWKYSGAGLDLSGYKFIVAVMEGGNSAGASFRVFDKDNYWTSPAMAGFNWNNRSIINLEDLNADDGTRMDPSHIYIVGFWSWGGTPFRISKVYVTTSSDPFVETGGVTEVLYDAADSRPVNVYDIMGRIVRNGVPYSDALTNLPHGMYIVDGKKIKI